MSVLITECEKYQRVADIAALCCIDLTSNLNLAYEEYMSGEISRGAYEHVRSRHLMIHAALIEAGFTEKHVFYEYPVKPGRSTSPPEF